MGQTTLVTDNQSNSPHIVITVTTSARNRRWLNLFWWACRLLSSRLWVKRRNFLALCGMVRFKDEFTGSFGVYVWCGSKMDVMTLLRARCGSKANLQAPWSVKCCSKIEFLPYVQIRKNVHTDGPDSISCLCEGNLTHLV